MIERFVSRRRDDWQCLEELLRLARGSRVDALTADQIVELGRLYRRAAADLAGARRDFPQDRVTLYLNQLVARAHGVVYRSEAGEWRQVVAFFRSGFPALFRATWPFTFVAFAVFAVAALAAYSAVLLSPDSAPYLVPADIIASVKERRMWTDTSALPPPIMATAIMQNNIRVAVFAFAVGILLGIPTFYVLALNGLMLGGVAALCQSYGLAFPLWSFVAPHGFIELTVIFIASGAGLRLGYALLQPGFLSRGRALASASREVVRLLFGCVPLLIVAGTIEGFISPSALPPELKVILGLTSGCLLYYYLLRAGRSRQSQQMPASSNLAPFR